MRRRGALPRLSLSARGRRTSPVARLPGGTWATARGRAVARNRGEAVVGPVASPVPGADEEDAVPGAADTGNIGETAMGSATSSGPVADEEDAAPGAGEEPRARRGRGAGE